MCDDVSGKPSQLDQGLQIPESHEAILGFKRLDDHNYDAGLSGSHELDCYCCTAQGSRDR